MLRALRCALWGVVFGAVGRLGLNPEAFAAWSSQPQGFAGVPAVLWPLPSPGLQQGGTIRVRPSRPRFPPGLFLNSLGFQSSSPSVSNPPRTASGVPQR